MRSIYVSILLVFICHLSFAQISITESNDDIVIDNYGIKNSYPKEGVHLELGNSMLEVKYELGTVLTIRDYTTVTTPSSGSFAALFTNLLAIIDNPAAGGGGIEEEVDPVFSESPAFGITAPNITSWNTVTGKADINSQTFTGTPSLPTGTIGVTQTAGNSSTALATTAFVTTADNLKANINSQAFTGTPSLPTGTTAVTQTAGNNTTAIATTAFATTADNLKANLAGGATFTGTIGLPSTTSIGNVSSTEIGYVDGVTSAIQTQIDAKSPINNPTLTGTTTTNAILPSANATYDFGSTSMKWTNVWTNRVNANGTLTLISNASSPILFSTTSPSSGIIGGFSGTDGKLILQAAGTSLTTSTGELLQAYGTAKITGATGIGGNLTLSSVPALGTTATNFLTSDAGVVSSRTLAQVKTDLAVPLSTDFIGSTGNQTGLTGDKTTAGTWTFSAPPSISGATVTGDIVFSPTGTLNVGSTSGRANNMYASNFVSSGAVGYGAGATNGAINIRQGSTSQLISGWFATSGRMWLQPSGTAPTDLGSDKQLQVYGSIALPTISSGIYLTAPNGTIYKLTVSNAGAAVFTAQ